MSSEPKTTGGCQCGAVRYAVSGPLGRASICHCRMCQKAFGSFYAPLVSVPLDAFSITRGNLGLFKSSDAVERGFCRDCGTPLSFRYLNARTIDVSIGSLDDPSRAKPVIQYGTESRVSWLDELDRLPGRSTAEGENQEQLALIEATTHQHPDYDTEHWPAGNRPG